MFLPRNTDLNQLAEVALSVDPPWSLEACYLLTCYQYPDRWNIFGAIQSGISISLGYFNNNICTISWGTLIPVLTSYASMTSVSFQPK